MSEIDIKVQEWIKGPEDKLTPPPALPYQEKLVAFIDILGVTDKVEKDGSEAENIVHIMNTIRSHVDAACSTLIKTEGFYSLQIGDGFVIIANFNNIDEVCKMLSTVQWQVLISPQMLLRGALTAGKVAIGEEGEYFIGPAIIEAFKLERQNAIFPRIIVDNNKIEESIKAEDFTYPYIKDDRDKIKYINFLHNIMDDENWTPEQLGQFLTDHEVDKMLITQYETLKKDNKRAAQKYGWLISYLASHGVHIV